MAVSSSPTARTPFDPDGSSLTPNDADSVPAAPALSSSAALARFEFEAGRANEGTKILMVEWDDESLSGSNNAKSDPAAAAGLNDGAAGEKESLADADWEVSWEGKSTVLSARDGALGSRHRLYFLLPPYAAVPRKVTISRKGSTEQTIQTNPLPAIFPKELGASARTEGKKGVLHTIWAKKRLRTLEREIEEELRGNSEGVALEMCRQEVGWIEENFGVVSSQGGAVGNGGMEPPLSPMSPKSPVGGAGRMAEKLKGLKLGTSEKDLSTYTPDPSEHLLSPDTGDVAVSSFSLFHTSTASPASARTPQSQTQASTQSTPRAMKAQSPPAHITAAQGGSPGSSSNLNSLNALARGDAPIPAFQSLQTSFQGRCKGDEEEESPEEALFAVQMSPRSPDMARSPFSFAARDTERWVGTTSK